MAAVTTWWPPFFLWKCFASQGQRLRQLPHVLLSHANGTFQEREKEKLFQCHKWSFVSISMERTKQRGHHSLFKTVMLGHHFRDSHQILNGMTFSQRLKTSRRKQERCLVWAMFCSRKHLNKTKLKCVANTVTVVPYLNAISWIPQRTHKTRMSWFHLSRSILYPWRKFVLAAKKSRKHCLSQMRR